MEELRALGNDLTMIGLMLVIFATWGHRWAKNQTAMIAISILGPTLAGVGLLLRWGYL